MKQTKRPYMRPTMQVYDVETSAMILAGSDTRIQRTKHRKNRPCRD